MKRNFFLILGCLPLLQAWGASCPRGFELEEEMCLPSGHSLAGDSSVKPSGACPSGYAIDSDGLCSPRVNPGARPESSARKTQVVIDEATGRPKHLQRKIKDAVGNVRSFLKEKLHHEPPEAITEIFCANPYQWVCQTSDRAVEGSSWPGHIFPTDPQGAFQAGKEIFKYILGRGIGYRPDDVKHVKQSLDATQVQAAAVSGPLAWPTNIPLIQVPSNGRWNLFSVFHELGHIIDFNDLSETTLQGLSSKQEENFINSTHQHKEIAADKFVAKGFALLADPHLRQVGYEPISKHSLLKTLKSAMGWLCNRPANAEHPDGNTRITYIGSDATLRSVLGCSVPPAWAEPNLAGVTR